MEFEGKTRESIESVSKVRRLVDEFEEAFFEMPGFTQAVSQGWSQDQLRGKKNASIIFENGSDAYGFSRTLFPDGKKRGLVITVTADGLTRSLVLNPSCGRNMIIYNEGKGGKELVDERALGKVDELLRYLKKPATTK